MSQSQAVVDNFMISIKCKKQGHETQPIMYVCTIGTCKDRLACATCMVSSHSHHAKNLQNIRQYLSNYISLEDQRDRIMKDNLLYAATEANQTKLVDDRKSFETVVQNSFVDLMKLTKIVYENAQDKFKIHNKQMYDSIENSIEETNQILNRKEPTTKQKIEKCPGNMYDNVSDLCDDLLKNTSLNSLSSLEVKDKVKKLPVFDNAKFKKIKDEILEYIKEKLKQLLEHHDIKMIDLSWHSRSAEMLKMYVGHTDHVMDMTVLNDGTLVSCSKDKTLRFWDTETHQCTQTTDLFDKNLNSICTMPDGTIAVAKDNVIKFYSAAKNEIEKALTGHVKTILALQPLPDGNLLSAGQDQVIKLWNVKTGQLMRSYYGHDDYIRRLHLTKDNKIISASDDKSVKIWDLKTGEILNSFDSNNDYVYAIDVMKNGYVVTGSRDGMVQIWDPEKSVMVQKFKAHNSFIYSLVVLTDNTIATGSADNTIRIWNPKTGDMIRKLEGHKFPVRQLKVLQDGNLASCAEDNMVIIWASKKLEVIHTFQHDKAVWTVASLPGNRFVSGSEDKSLKIWDAIKGGPAIATKTDHSEQVRAVLYIGNNKFASASSDKTIKIWSCNDYSLIKTITGHEGGVRSLSQPPDEPDKLISGAEDKTVKVWDINSGNCLQTLQGHDDFVRVCKAISNKKLASGSRDNTLRIWSLETSQVETILRGHQLPIWSILEIEPGKKMATGSSDYTIRIWNLETNKTIQQLHGHTGPIWALVKLSENIIASGSEDCMLRLWDWEQGDCIRSLLSHSYGIWGLAIDDSENVATASWDKTVKVWNVKKREIME